ncbi:hypothetical protein CCH79_00014508 [Gambusia affinis]|uniref:Ig-like domain-containing protein n=1 Tax=Gambusia affinis TaxID=33528 RepID=A0A315USF3_GAMAF|nr:hypothetical protein CCH79_00014508 [Gambusia affinis]
MRDLVKSKTSTESRKQTQNPGPGQGGFHIMSNPDIFPNHYQYTSNPKPDPNPVHTLTLSLLASLTSWVSTSVFDFHTVVVQPREEVTLWCSNFSALPVHIFWYKLVDGSNASCISSMFSSEVEASLREGFGNGKFNMTSNRTNVFLSIKQVDASDSGLYICGFGKDFEWRIFSSTYLQVEARGDSQNPQPNKDPVSDNLNYAALTFKSPKTKRTRTAEAEKDLETTVVSCCFLSLSGGSVHNMWLRFPLRSRPVAIDPDGLVTDPLSLWISDWIQRDKSGFGQPDLNKQRRAPGFWTALSGHFFSIFIGSNFTEILVEQFSVVFDRNGAKRDMVTLEEKRRSTAQVGEQKNEESGRRSEKRKEQNLDPDGLNYAALHIRPKAKSKRKPADKEELKDNVVYAATR